MRQLEPQPNGSSEQRWSASTFIVLMVALCTASCGPPPGIGTFPTRLPGPLSGVNCPAGTVLRGRPPPQGKKLWCIDVARKSEGRAAREGPVVSWSCHRCRDGAQLHGHYRGGERHGLWTLWREDGTKIDEGVWQDGKRTGRFEGWHAGGKPSFRKQYGADGKLDGPAWYRYASGKRQREGTYKLGVRIGLWREWHESGQLESEGAYVDGKRDGEWALYDAKGKLLRRVRYKLGRALAEAQLRDGVMVLTSKDARGRLLRSWSEKDGKSHGPEVVYHPSNGKVARKVTWQMGVMSGPVSLHREDGSIAASGTLVNGKRGCDWRRFDTLAKDVTRRVAFAAIVAQVAAGQRIKLPADACKWTLNDLVPVRRGADDAGTIAIARWIVEHDVVARQDKAPTTEPAPAAVRIAVLEALAQQVGPALAKQQFEIAALLTLAVLVEVDRMHAGSLLTLDAAAQALGAPDTPAPPSDAAGKQRSKALAVALLPAMKTMLWATEGDKVARKSARVTLGKAGVNKLTFRAFSARLQ